MGADELIEERPEVNHGLAEILGARLTAPMTNDNFAARSVVVQHSGVLDGEIVQPAIGILNRVTTCTHDFFDEAIRLIHGSPWVIDKSPLNRAPRLSKLVCFFLTQCPQRERLHASLPLQQLALGFRR